ncbi:cupin domain-containing protein [Catenovulum sediminis]|uniref:Cupin domain-containing protein n=1 Tax=Catenovulum sediminis TaxID=1740262 RepID=A0ABV1RDT2_9ALTE
MNFSLRIALDTQHIDWQASPKFGVWRKPLAREFKEQGHATSLVKFEAGAQFSEHDHPKGEEILVLDGTFSDHTGDYHQGQYFRNPKGFRHAPFSEAGCLIFVKLHQFQKTDQKRVCIDTNTANWQKLKNEIKILHLHQHLNEQVTLFHYASTEVLANLTNDGGAEIYVIKGELSDADGRYQTGSWLRIPHLSPYSFTVQANSTVWLKVGHLFKSG